MQLFGSGDTVKIVILLCINISSCIFFYLADVKFQLENVRLNMQTEVSKLQAEVVAVSSCYYKSKSITGSFK